MAPMALYVDSRSHLIGLFVECPFARPEKHDQSVEKRKVNACLPDPSLVDAIRPSLLEPPVRDNPSQK